MPGEAAGDWRDGGGWGGEGRPRPSAGRCETRSAPSPPPLAELSLAASPLVLLRADCRGDDFGMRRRGGGGVGGVGRRRVKHLYSDSWWKCLFSQLDTDLKVIRLVLCSCPAVKA